MALKLPTPPTPPTIDKGEAADSAPRIDAHQFFEVPFKREDFQPKIETEEKTVAEVQEKPVEKKLKSPPKIRRRKFQKEKLQRPKIWRVNPLQTAAEL